MATKAVLTAENEALIKERDRLVKIEKKYLALKKSKPGVRSDSTAAFIRSKDAEIRSLKNDVERNDLTINSLSNKNNTLTLSSCTTDTYIDQFSKLSWFSRVTMTRAAIIFFLNHGE